MRRLMLSGIRVLASHSNLLEEVQEEVVEVLFLKIDVLMEIPLQVIMTENVVIMKSLEQETTTLLRRMEAKKTTERKKMMVRKKMKEEKRMMDQRLLRRQAKNLLKLMNERMG